MPKIIVNLILFGFELYIFFKFRTPYPCKVGDATLLSPTAIESPTVPPPRAGRYLSRVGNLTPHQSPAGNQPTHTMQLFVST
jgi:hypothetical protein